jgi:hypothetical protein
MAPGKRDARQAAEHSARPHARAKAAAVTDAERDRIRELHGQGLSCNAIAAQLGRSRSTISYWCKAMGLSFDRAPTADAVRAHVVDAKARRARLAENYLGDAERLREQLWEACEDMAPVGGMEPTVLRWRRDEPSFQDKERLVRASGLAADKHMKLAEFDSDDGAADAKALLGRLSEALGVAARELGDGDDQS